MGMLLEKKEKKGYDEYKINSVPWNIGWIFVFLLLIIGYILKTQSPGFFVATWIILLIWAIIINISLTPIYAAYFSSKSITKEGPPLFWKVVWKINRI